MCNCAFHVLSHVLYDLLERCVVSPVSGSERQWECVIMSLGQLLENHSTSAPLSWPGSSDGRITSDAAAGHTLNSVHLSTLSTLIT